jgi:hypothetical protein
MNQKLQNILFSSVLFSYLLKIEREKTHFFYRVLANKYEEEENKFFILTKVKEQIAILYSFTIRLKKCNDPSISTMND